MKITNQIADGAILGEFGARIARLRITRQLTQAQLAEQAGIAKRTLERIEAGVSAQMTSLIRVLRILDLLQALDTAIPESGPRPMDLLKLKGRQRRRASPAAQVADTPWSWNDDT